MRVRRRYETAGLNPLAEAVGSKDNRGVMWQRFWCLLLLLGIGAATLARGQIDPEKRRLIQLGYNQPLEGRGPIAGYGYFFLNEPDFGRTNLTLRLALAPIYLDSELGIRQALGPATDLGLGLAGGGFADSYSELRGGQFLREESFTGHGGELNASLYHCLNPQDRIPFYAILRAGAHQSIYERDSTTAPDFVLPDDQTIAHVRTGLRWGGKEPLMLPALAMEVSLWYEGQFRAAPGAYGFAGDRSLNPAAHLFWTRALWAYTLPESQQRLSLSVTLGSSLETDRLSAYRLGGVLPLVSEFPLSLPGYYFQEISARRFGLVDGQYALPLDTAEMWSVIGFASSGLVDYLPGLEQPGHWHSGVGGGLSFQSRSRAWRVVLAYGYGIDAIRSQGRGANAVGLLCQLDLEARRRAKTAGPRPPINPNKLRGLDWLFGR